jgi:hypothetical protein
MPKPGTYKPDTASDTTTVTKQASDSIRLEDTSAAPKPGTYTPPTTGDSSQS